MLSGDTAQRSVIYHEIVPYDGVCTAFCRREQWPRGYAALHQDDACAIGAPRPEHTVRAGEDAAGYYWRLATEMIGAVDVEGLGPMEAPYMRTRAVHRDRVGVRGGVPYRALACGHRALLSECPSEGRVDAVWACSTACWAGFDQCFSRSFLTRPETKSCR